MNPSPSLRQAFEFPASTCYIFECFSKSSVGLLSYPPNRTLFNRPAASLATMFFIASGFRRILYFTVAHLLRRSALLPYYAPSCTMYITFAICK